jgi:hypothetical protein
MLKRPSDKELSNNASDWTSGSNPSKDQGSFTSLRSLIQPRELPEVESLSDIELIGLLNEIEFDLMQKQVEVDFLDQLPARVAYRGILQLLDSPVELDGSSFLIKHIDGCDSACESCFQLAYCSVSREVLGPDWTIAVQHAKINPSWSALFSKEDSKEEEG